MTASGSPAALKRSRTAASAAGSTGPVRGPRHVGKDAEDAAQVGLVRADEPGGQEVQAQVGVVRVLRRLGERGDDRAHGRDAHAATLVGPRGGRELRRAALKPSRACPPARRRPAPSAAADTRRPVPARPRSAWPARRPRPARRSPRSSRGTLRVVRGDTRAGCLRHDRPHDRRSHTLAAHSAITADPRPAVTPAAEPRRGRGRAPPGAAPRSAPGPARAGRAASRRSTAISSRRRSP